MNDSEQIAELLQRAASIQHALENQRTPSKAHLIGPDRSPYEDSASNFFALVAKAGSTRLAGGIQGQMDAQAELDSMGSTYGYPDPASKATVGDTDAAGGYLVPNNEVTRINEQATPRRGVVDLFSPVNGVRGAAVDIPWEDTVPTRAVIAAPGATKENTNFITGNYTATLYTLARIFDVGNQLLRRSEGAAENIVRTKLARAIGLGEDYYALSGTGTSEPFGLLTAIGTSGTFVTTFSSPSDSTVAGSIAAAIATAAGDLEARGALADGVVMNTTDYWRMLRQGADTAGFWLSPGVDVQSGRALSAWGIPIRHTPNIASDTLVVGEFKSVEFYRGQGYRVDVSSEAGDRWDKNLTGFRGEEDIAFDARPAVYAGRFQRITNAHA